MPPSLPEPVPTEGADLQLFQWMGALDRDVQAIAEQIKKMESLNSTVQKNEIEISHVKEILRQTLERLTLRAASIEQDVKALQAQNQKLREKDAAQQAQIVFAGAIATLIGGAWIATILR